MLIEVTTDEIRQSAESLEGFAKTLREYADEIDAEKMQVLYLHWLKFSGTIITDIEDYLEKIGPPISKQLRAHRSGKANPYQKSKERADKDHRTKAGKFKLEHQLAAEEAAAEKSSKKRGRPPKKKGA